MFIQSQTWEPAGLCHVAWELSGLRFCMSLQAALGVRTGSQGRELLHDYNPET